jgi:formylglycine-generating enzyme required for sulfatase activity
MIRDPCSTWHWPSFPAALCGDMTDRERLGLPDRFVTARLDHEMSTAYAALHRDSRDDLAQRTNSANATLAERIVAGNLLALLGDPRISVQRPDMVEIAGGDVDIGLEPADVDGVLEHFSSLGLDRAWIEKECPRHRTTLRPYRIARLPVTNGEYRTFLLETGHADIPSSWAYRQFPRERANHPVYSVSAHSADAFAAWLAQRSGRGFRLPTEAEWEWAAAGPDGRVFPWGSRFDAELTNTAECGLFTTTPVGAFAGGESAFGLCDMAGNVEEYVADDYAPYPGGSFITDHLVKIQGGYRIARGGSFARFRDLARTRRRHGHNPRSATYAMGFRLAESP